ncbi:MAG: hypothetical protein HY941_06305, partial [Gammaproteobacteria bacterium]|nr:hypothetical protein [Gammaproteobacteria bacterium]
EKIESIKLVQADGLWGSTGSASGTDGIFDSALKFKARAPFIDSLLRDLGLEVTSLEGSLAKAGSACNQAVICSRRSGTRGFRVEATRHYSRGRPARCRPICLRVIARKSLKEKPCCAILRGAHGQAHDASQGTQHSD